MEIRKTRKSDLEEILKTYAYARETMKKSGNPTQWGDSRPAASIIESDIENGLSYAVCDGGELCAVFVFFIGKDPFYSHIEGGNWLNDEEYGVIHRVASNGKRKGVLSEIFGFCEGKISNLRIDTHNDNKIMQHLIEKNGFTKCGIVYVDNGTPRIAYQRKTK